MPLDKSHKMDYAGLEIVASEFTGTLNGPVNIIGLPVALTGTAGGTANDVLVTVPAATAASTDPSAASLASTNAAINVIKDDIQDLFAKVNALLVALA